MDKNVFTDQDIRAIFDALAGLMNEKKEWLIELDGAMGDGDLGLTMSTGFSKAAEALHGFPETDIGKILGKAGMVFAQAVPSTMGTLMATGLMKGGKVIQGKQQIDLADFAAMLNGFVEGIMARGKAKPGDKTIIDALHPAVLALQAAAEAGKTLAEGLRAAYEAAAQGLEATKQMVSQHGRAAYYQEKSLGKADPGATVGMLFMQAFADYCR
ncbi:dihydroxyacetone kinase subunit DhaL [Hydrogenispora ethanolica]|uniref:dihydroxyacetone kinase subunit DhaL n=1 Tax=Hydrogenispora ethanolica TaxID=1082276 RepID=UPI00105187CD|nr:dihydroxyacetone kinase subunit DhaL [Hydrogenispora ethanolica]